jgi:hypothetical protein
MGVEATRHSQYWDAALRDAGLLGHVQPFPSRRSGDLPADGSPPAASLEPHWNQQNRMETRLASQCGMRLAVLSCSEALHPRVGLANQEAA